MMIVDQAFSHLKEKVGLAQGLAPLLNVRIEHTAHPELESWRALATAPAACVTLAEMGDRFHARSLPLKESLLPPPPLATPAAQSVSCPPEPHASSHGRREVVDFWQGKQSKQNHHLSLCV
jgi:hypothetical protein